MAPALPSSLLSRVLAALFAVLWCLPLASPFALATLRGAADKTVFTSVAGPVASRDRLAQERHDASCHCASCPAANGGARAGKHCCCLVAHTAQEGMALRAVCDETASTRIAAAAKGAIRPPALMTVLPPRVFLARPSQLIPTPNADLPSLAPTPLYPPPRVS